MQIHLVIYIYICVCVYAYIYIYIYLFTNPCFSPRRSPPRVRTSKTTVFCGTKCTCPWSWLSSCNAQLSNLCVECYNTIIIIIIIILLKIRLRIKFRGSRDLLIPWKLCWNILKIPFNTPVNIPLQCSWKLCTCCMGERGGCAYIYYICEYFIHVYI